MKLTLTTDELRRFEAQLSVWGPLALDMDNFCRFQSEWIVGTNADIHGYVMFSTDSKAAVELEIVGDIGINGDGYTRVSAVGGKPLGKGAKVAIIPIMGPVIPHVAPSWLAEYGIRVASLPNIVSAARAAANDVEVGKIVYLVHSPGGSSFGVAEATEQLRAISEKKPTVAMINFLGASAAYWLASAQREIVAEQSALVGSVGVRVSHMDISKSLEQEGVKVTDISIPESKTDLSPYKPLSETAKAELVAIVQDEYDRFARDVSTSRHVDMHKMSDKYGRVHSASKAKSIAMIDRVASFESLLGESVPTADLTATRRARLAIMKRKS